MYNHLETKLSYFHARMFILIENYRHSMYISWFSLWMSLLIQNALVDHPDCHRIQTIQSYPMYRRVFHLG